jgi:hypothetical protein
MSPHYTVTNRDGAALLGGDEPATFDTEASAIIAARAQRESTSSKDFPLRVIFHVDGYASQQLGTLAPSGRFSYSR